MQNTPDTKPTPTENPHNLPPALLRAQRPMETPVSGIGQTSPKSEPSLASLGITDFVPANTKAGVSTPEDPVLRSAFVYIATFAIKKGNGPSPAHTNVKIEVADTGTPQENVASAWAEVRRQFPQVPKNHIVRTSGKLAERAGTGAQSIPLSDGMTVRQLFPDKTEFEASRLVGRISFEDAPHDVILRHIRAKSVFSLTLKPLKGPSVINFSEQVTVMRLASELPAIINQLLGDSGKNLELYFQKS